MDPSGNRSSETPYLLVYQRSEERQDSQEIYSTRVSWLFKIYKPACFEIKNVWYGENVDTSIPQYKRWLSDFSAEYA